MALWCLRKPDIWKAHMCCASPLRNPPKFFLKTKPLLVCLTTECFQFGTLFLSPFHLPVTSSLALWLRCPPREWQTQGSSHTSGLKIGTPLAWRYRFSARTGRLDVRILWLGEIEILICKFYPSVAACTIVWADPSLRYTSMLLGC